MLKHPHRARSTAPAGAGALHPTARDPDIPTTATQAEETSMKATRAQHARSISDPRGFWGEQAARIDWQTPYENVLDDSKPPFARWFVGGRTNLCHNAVDRHLAARADQRALVYVSTETREERIFSYRELHREVNRMAAVLQALGVRQGDRVLLYMPMIPEAAFAMLACARIGAIHSVV